ncbi:hypothetical protein BDZ94DRAFT_159237 [Collybia nuda]|uniref:F-box domain-containing protein n=1 Tax=Collybia nuda TaxID=64659 RepID=A0A9P5XWE7_9AGAR|nr:hypothetical protein BDZ94DRAFT_159237 [Collybia nuda]
MSSWTSLSQEVIDQIIDHLHDHSGSLGNCALVERNWIPASRYHLFWTVNLHKGSLFYNSNKNVPRVKRLLKLLNSPYSTITHDIREIALIFSLVDCEYLSYLVLRVTARLPGLRSLIFLPDPADSTWAWCDIESYEITCFDDEVDEFYAGFDESLSDWSDLTENFVRIVCSIPHLQQLKATWIPKSEVGDLLLRPFPPHLGHLTVRALKPVMIRWWLADEKHIPIQSIELHSIYPSEIPLIGTFLRTLGPSLLDLRVSFRGPRIETEDLFCVHVNLAYNVSLRSIEIGDVALEPRRGGQVYFEWLFTMLSQIRASDIKRLKIWMHAGEASLETFDWGRLDEILATPPLDNIEMLTFGTYVFDRHCDFLGGVIKFLPNYEGRIQVEYFESCDYAALQV